MSLFTRLVRSSNQSKQVFPLSQDLQNVQDSVDTLDNIWNELKNIQSGEVFTTITWKSLQQAYILRDFESIIKILKHDLNYQRTKNKKIIQPILNRLQLAMLDFEMAKQNTSQPHMIVDAPLTTNKKYVYEKVYMKNLPNNKSTYKGGQVKARKKSKTKSKVSKRNKYKSTKKSSKPTKRRVKNSSKGAKRTTRYSKKTKRSSRKH